MSPSEYMMGNNPRLSVIMPTLNIQNYIENSTTAVLDSTFENLELLILDGGSSDGTLEYCKKIDDHRVRIFKDVGDRIAARNRGIREAEGEFIAIVDADTVPAETRFGKAINFLDTNPDYAAVGSYMRHIEPDGSTWVSKKPVEYNKIRNQLLYNNPVCHPTLVVRTEVLKEIDGYRDRNYEDYDLIIRIAQKHKIHNQDEILVDSYVREKSVSNSMSDIIADISTLRCNFAAIKMLDLPAYYSIYMLFRRVFVQIGFLIYRKLK